MATNKAVSDNDRRDAGRIAKALRGAVGCESLEDLSINSGVPARRVAALVKRFPRQIAKHAGLGRIEYLPGHTIVSGSGAFGNYGNARGGYEPATIAVYRRRSR